MRRPEARALGALWPKAMALIWGPTRVKSRPGEGGARILAQNEGDLVTDGGVWRWRTCGAEEAGGRQAGDGRFSPGALGVRTGPQARGREPLPGKRQRSDPAPSAFL